MDILLDSISCLLYTSCEDAGIPVINVDTAVDASDKVVSIIASDNYKAGVECAKDMMKMCIRDRSKGIFGKNLFFRKFADDDH